MSKPTKDWILDNIVQSLQDRCLLSISEAIACLDDTYEVYASSPKFLTDWRWYKDLVGNDQKFSELALLNYYQNNLNSWTIALNFLSIQLNLVQNWKDWAHSRGT
jgi:hypothetical protein